MDGFRILSDNPVSSADTDLWQLDDAAADLARLVRTVDQPPLTVGVFGGWGTGKTSLLRLMRAHLEGDEATAVAWLDAWRFRDREELWIAMLQCVVDALRRDPGVVSRMAERLSGFLAGASRVFLSRGAQVASAGLVNAADVDRVWDAMSAQRAERTAQLSAFADEFDAVVDEALRDRRLVVMVDDLDRCGTKATLEILEGIKLHLGSSKCVFVVALDPDAYADALRARYPDSPEFQVGYLEKHIQLVRYVPQPTDDRLRSGLAALCGAELPDAAWHLVCAAARGNPRRAKRFVNMLMLTDGWAGQDTDTLLLHGRLLVLRLQFPRFAAMLSQDPALWRDAERHLDDGSILRAERAAVVARHLEDRRLAAFLRETGRRSPHAHPPAPGPEAMPELLRRAWRYGPAADTHPPAQPPSGGIA